MTISVLIDSNVLIAMVAEAHEHHVPSVNLLIHHANTQFAITALSYAEAYNT